jgi:AbiU2
MSIDDHRTNLEHSVDQQVNELRQLFEHLDIRYMTLIANFAVLRPAVIHKPLARRLFREGKTPAASLVATALFDVCTLSAWTLIFDKGPENPSIAQLMRPFHFKRRAENAELLKRLESGYAERPIYWPDTEEAWPPALIQDCKDRHDQETEARRREFRSLVDELSCAWGLLCRTFQPLNVLRTKFIAHYELDRDSSNGTLQLAQTLRPPELYSALRDSVHIIARMTVNLATALNNTDIGLQQLSLGCRRQAAIFWGLIRSPRLALFSR